MQLFDCISFNDDPCFQTVNSQVSYSSIIFLKVKEVEEDDIELGVYLTLHDAKSKLGPDCKEDTMHHTCHEWFYNVCCEFLFGGYHVSAVKHYFEENKYIATERDAYVTFMDNFNWKLAYTFMKIVPLKKWDQLKLHIHLNVWEKEVWCMPFHGSNDKLSMNLTLIGIMDHIVNENKNYLL